MGVFLLLYRYASILFVSGSKPTVDGLVWDQEAVGSTPTSPTIFGALVKLVKTAVCKTVTTGSNPVPSADMAVKRHHWSTRVGDKIYIIYVAVPKKK